MEILNVLYKAKKGKGIQFYNELREAGIVQATRAEKGLMAYDFYQSLEDPDTLLLLEIWEDEETRAKHKTTDHFEHLTRLYEIYIASYTVNVYKKENK